MGLRKGLEELGGQSQIILRARLSSLSAAL